MKLTAYRLVARRFMADAFTGQGARVWGGRWNPAGVGVVYTSGTLSLASLEFLAHFDTGADLPDLVSYRLLFEEPLVTDIGKLPADWRQIPSPASTQQLGNLWWKNQRSAVLRVPSVIIPGEDNFVLNPTHPDFKTITIESPQSFSIDPRLFA